MTEKAGIIFDHDDLLVTGVIDFSSVVSLWNKSLPLIEQIKKLSFDFAKVTSTNSAALALLLEWIKYAKREQKPIIFRNLPLQLMTVATMAGIDKILNTNMK